MLFRVLSLVSIVAAVTNCGNQQAASNTATLPNTSQVYLKSSGSNVVNVTVGGNSFCGTHGYPNEPCASVTICEPGTTNCQTISDVLVDTGSVGLRLFSSVVKLNLNTVKDKSSNIIAECAQFGSGSDWGTLVKADVALAGNKASNIPIHLIDSTFGTLPGECADADIGPYTSGYNGILGVGLFTEDCGSICAQDGDLRIFFSCAGTTCVSTALATANQPQNPISHFSTDSNGLILAMPQVPVGGASQVSGVLLLGVGTRTNNLTGNLSPFQTSAVGYITTQLAGKNLVDSFLDSGSNGLFFPNLLSLPTCGKSAPASSFYCPTSSSSYTAVNKPPSGRGTPSTLEFNISNAITLFSADSGNDMAFSDLAGVSSDGFDWGLPFFYGRAVVVGIEGTQSSMGVGPYFGF